MPELGAMTNQLLGQLLSGEAPYDISPQAREEFWSKGIEEPLMKQYQRFVLPQVKRRYSHAFWGSEANKGINQAQQDLMDTLAKARSNLMYQEELGNRAAKERALSRGLQTVPVASGLAGQLAQLGAVQRGLQDVALMRQYQDWLRTRPEYSPWLQMAPTFLSLTPYTQYPVSTIPKTSFGSALAGGLGGALGQGLGGLLSGGIGSILGNVLGGGAGPAAAALPFSELLGPSIGGMSLLGGGFGSALGHALGGIGKAVGGLF